MSSLPADLKVSDITPLAAHIGLFILIDSDIDNGLLGIMHVVCI